MLKPTSHPLGRGWVLLCWVYICDECKDVLDADQGGASGPLAPFRANGAHPSIVLIASLFSVIKPYAPSQCRHRLLAMTGSCHLN